MKLFKKIAGFILAFAMILAIAMPSVVMAEGNGSIGNGSITITGAKSGHTFEAYQISQVIYQKTESHYLISLGVVM